MILPVSIDIGTCRGNFHIGHKLLANEEVKRYYLGVYAYEIAKAKAKLAFDRAGIIFWILAFLFALALATPLMPFTAELGSIPGLRSGVIISLIGFSVLALGKTLLSFSNQVASRKRLWEIQQSVAKLDEVLTEQQRDEHCTRLQLLSEFQLPMDLEGGRAESRLLGGIK